MEIETKGGKGTQTETKGGKVRQGEATRYKGRKLRLRSSHGKKKANRRQIEAMIRKGLQMEQTGGKQANRCRGHTEQRGQIEAMTNPRIDLFLLCFRIRCLKISICFAHQKHILHFTI